MTLWTHRIFSINVFLIKKGKSNNMCNVILSCKVKRKRKQRHIVGIGKKWYFLKAAGDIRGDCYFLFLPNFLLVIRKKLSLIMPLVS